jgi:hypothetical protein
MTKQKRTQYRVLGLVSLSLIIAAATYGFAQANTISGVSGMGAGYGVKSSYEVSKVSYTLDIEDPGTFTAVDFTLEQEGSAIIVGVSASKKGEIIWADDCEKIGTQWTCSFDRSIDVLAADWLHVTSAQ